MKIAVWLKLNRIGRSEFAAMIGVSKGYVTQLCDGAHPSMAMAERIAAATNGAVTPNDFINLEQDVQP
jgi:3,4-dihydroxy 2-butanone 4-phosphate synthase/GTP cyclohydrolase II